MKTLHLDATELDLDFAARLRLAQAIARQLLGEAMLLSFYDRDRNLESPGGVSECHVGCPIPGWQEYAESRGGTLMVDFEHGRHVFCFMPLR
ncbi:MAG: AF1514 family protein [Thiobacillaceae bacterium]|nr:AF1514 family protein [Thiobacillaceae bacterium]MCX7673096.1 AF1514 family protein [Thiobacillaceae bacterium]MDW8323604.1 AF1514 family protein [Burkholderiales bacterium]